MAPGSISYHICFQSIFICIFTFCIYLIKYQKYIYLIILSLLDLTFASGREWIDNPFIALVASSQFVCVGVWDFSGASYWIDTLVLKTEGNTYATLCCITLSSSRKTNASSRCSKKDFWRRFYFTFFTLHLYHKNTKNIILSYLSDLTLVSDREGIDNPFIALVARFLFVLCRYEGLELSLLLD